MYIILPVLGQDISYGSKTPLGIKGKKKPTEAKDKKK